MVGLQAGQNHFLGIVFTPDQGRAIGVADLADFGRLREHVVDPPALAALTARRNARDQHLGGHVQMNGDGLGQAQLADQIVQEGSLFQRARIAIQQETGGAIGLLDSSGNDAIHDIVADQASGFQGGAGQAAEVGIGLAFGAEHLASGNGRDMEALGDRGSLCAFAAAWRSK